MVQRFTLFILLVVLKTANTNAQTTFFHESFDDELYSQRGWYDNNKLVISSNEHIKSSSASVEFHFLKGARTATSGGGIRHLFSPSAEVYLSYWIKYSLNWTGSNKPYHPHQFHFVTTEDDKYVGPSYTTLTLYIEENEGHPLLAFQDARNIDTTHIKVDLSKTSENRALAGCNGSSDMYPAGDCYQSGALWFNGKQWKSALTCFSQDQGPYFQNDWHHVEAYFRLNSIENGRAQADGVAQYWFDDSLIIDVRNTMFRTAQHPNMMFNQFLMAPYIGDGSPIDQTMWVDELSVGDHRPVLSNVEEEVQTCDSEHDFVVYDILGRVVCTLSYKERSMTSPLLSHCTNLRPGVYYIRTPGSQRGSAKLVLKTY